MSLRLSFSPNGLREAKARRGGGTVWLMEQRS